MLLKTALQRCAPKSPSLGLARAFSASASKGLDFSGVFTPIVTPFDDKEDVHYDKLAENFQNWNATALSGFLLLGSSGEGVLMTSQEKLELVKQSRQLLGEGKILIAGAGAESTRETIQLCEKMAEHADCVMVVTPSYFKASLNDESLMKHYSTVADHSPVPLLLYSVPSNTGVDLSVEAVRKLSEHPNIVGAKDSGGDVTKMAAMAHATKGQDFQLLAGSAGSLLASLTVGAVGGVCALANPAPRQLCALYEMWAKGEVEEARSLQQRLVAPNTLVTKTFGVAGIKASLDLVGLYGGPPRLPILPLSADQQASHICSLTTSSDVIHS